MGGYEDERFHGIKVALRQTDREREIEEEKEGEEKTTEESNFLAGAKRPARFKGRKSRDSICAVWVIEEISCGAGLDTIMMFDVRWLPQRKEIRKLPHGNGKLWYRGNIRRGESRDWIDRERAWCAGWVLFLASKLDLSLARASVYCLRENLEQCY